MADVVNVQGIRFTGAQIQALERAEQQTRERMCLGVRKQQFVNGIQDADAHESVPDQPSFGIPSSRGSARLHSRNNSVFGSDLGSRPPSALPEAGPYRQAPSQSSPGNLGVMSTSHRSVTMSTVDESPRARIQVHTPPPPPRPIHTYSLADTPPSGNVLSFDIALRQPTSMTAGTSAQRL